MATEEAPARERKTRGDKGPRLIERDLQALKWIAQQYAICLDHLCILLARLVGPGEYARTPKEAGELTQKRAMAIVRRWEQLGLVQKAWILHNDPAWVWLTGEGLRLVSEELGELRAYDPSPAKVNHLYWCNHARLYVENRRQDAEWTSERELKAGQKIERGAKRPHLPDATVLTNGKTIAIEVELAIKSYSRLDKILHELALNPEYSTVWYFTRERSTAVVNAAIGAMREMYKGKFVVYDLDDMPI
jgi:hypothetical protein